MELKELKPPFKLDGYFIKDGTGQKVVEIYGQICECGTRNDCIGCNCRNFNLCNALEEEVGKWVLSAVQEKYERDFNELRWLKTNIPLSNYDEENKTWLNCPRCNRNYRKAYEKCPGCLQRLLPPEGEGE